MQSNAASDLQNVNVETIVTEEKKLNLEQKTIAIESVDGSLFSENSKRFSLPLKYWGPTLISVISGTALLIWFVFSLINPLENDILELKTKGITTGTNSPVIESVVFLESTDGTAISDNQLFQIKNVVFKLEQRKDLVLLIAGYTDDNVENDQFQKVLNSKKAAERVRSIFINNGVNPNRIYFDGFGQDVPNGFFKTYRNNVALFVVNVFELMKGSGTGNPIRAI